MDKIVISKLGYKVRIPPDMLASERDMNLEYVLILVDMRKADGILLTPRFYLGVRTPDAQVGSELWECKKSDAGSASSVQHAFKSAKGQANNMFFDCRPFDIGTRFDSRKGTIKAEFKRRRLRAIVILRRSGATYYDQRTIDTL